MRPAGHKFCKGCNTYLEYARFYNCKRNGLQSRCKSCFSLYQNSRRELIKEAHRKRYLENPDRYKKANQKRRLLNPSGVANNIKAYKTRKSKAMPSWLSQDQLKEIENFYWLAADLKKVSGGTYHVDHIIPLQGKGVCGLHVPWNLQVLPKDINLQKSNNYDMSGGAR